MISNQLPYAPTSIALPPPPPTNSDTRAAIDRLAAYTARNGRDFESMIMKEQRYNPEFRFLFDRQSPDYQYYRWAIQQYQLGSHAGISIGSVSTPSHHHLSTSHSSAWRVSPPSNTYTAATSSVKPSNISFSADEWNSIVASVDVSKQSVKQACDWLFRCQLTKDIYRDCIISIKSRMLSFGFEPQEFYHKLALLYLINEILHRAKHDQGASASPHPIILEFCGHLGPILQRVYAMNSPSNQQQVESVVDLWRQRSIISPATCDVLRAQMIMEIVTPKRGREKIEPPEFRPELPPLPPNAILASTFIVLPSEVVEACKGASPYTTLNQLAFSALARRTHLGDARDYELEADLLDDFYDDLEALTTSHEPGSSRHHIHERNRRDRNQHGRRSRKSSRSRSRSRSREKYRSSSSRYYDSRSPSVERSRRRASRSRSWSRGRSPSPSRY